MTQYLFLATAGIFALAIRSTSTELVPADPVEVRFDKISLVFTNGQDGLNAAERITKFHLRREFLLDATVSDDTKTNWCKRVTEKSYKDEFRVATFSVAKLQNLRTTTERQLSQSLGEPAFAEGPYAGIALVYAWRVCNGKRGHDFSAVQVFAGFDNAAATNALFLLVCTQENEGSHKKRAEGP